MYRDEKKYSKPFSQHLIWAGPAAAVKAALREVKPENEKMLYGIYEVTVVLESYPADKGVVVAVENRGTAREHFTVRPCVLV